MAIYHKPCHSLISECCVLIIFLGQYLLPATTWLQVVYDVKPVIFSVVGVNLLVLFFPHVILESISVFELFLTIQAQQPGGEREGGGEGERERDRVDV